MEKLSVVTVNQKVGMGGESSSAMPKGYLNTQTDEERLFRNLLELRLHRQRIQYMVFPAIWSIFGWSRTEWDIIQ